MEDTELSWLSTHQDQVDEYAGKWIAILGDKILAIGESVESVMNKVAKLKLNELPLITKIPREDEGTYVL